VRTRKRELLIKTARVVTSGYMSLSVTTSRFDFDGRVRWEIRSGCV
jgi:hypothetical protein